MLTPRQAQFAFVPLVVTLMSGVMSFAMIALHRGFGPGLIDAWLRGPLRTWAADLLGSRRLRETGLVQLKAMDRVWTEHLSGRRDHASALWAALMLSSWLDARA